MPLKSDRTHAPYLGEFELLVLLAILRLRDEAYGVTIRDELERQTSRATTMGAIYKTLRRLEDKRYVSTWIGDPTSERGGRRKRFYGLQPLGRDAVKQSVSDVRRLARGLEKALETP